MSYSCYIFGEVELSKFVRANDAASQIVEGYAGVAVPYVDSHFHLHKFEASRAALRRVLPTLGVTRFGNVQSIYIRKAIRTFAFWYGPIWRSRIRRSFTTTDHFYMPPVSCEGNWDTLLLERPAKESAGSVEVAVHPGSGDSWRSVQRSAVLRFAEAAKARGHELVGWRQI